MDDPDLPDGRETPAVPQGPDRTDSLANQAIRLELRYQAAGHRRDLDDAIALGAEALMHAPPSGPARAGYLANQATRFQLRYEAAGQGSDLDAAITLGAEALLHAPASGPDRAMYLSNQANRLRLRYQAAGHRLDLDEAIALRAEALVHAPSGPEATVPPGLTARRLRHSGLFVEALARAEDDVVEALDSGDAARAAAARIEVALVAGELSGPEAAIAHLHDIDVPEGAEAVAASLSFYLGALYVVIGEPAAGLQRLDDAHHRYARLGDGLTMGRVSAERAVARAALDDWQEAVHEATAAFAALAHDEADGEGDDEGDVARRWIRGRGCLSVARVLQDGGRFRSADPGAPGALEVLDRAIQLLDGTGDEAYAAVALAHFRHTELYSPTPHMAAVLAPALAVDAGADLADWGLAGAEVLARRGQGQLAGAAFGDVSRLLWRAPTRALPALRRAADVHRNLGAHAELALDLASVAAVLAADGDMAGAADTVELGLRAARRDPGGAGHAHAALLGAAAIVGDDAGNDLWLAGCRLGDVTDLWAGPPGPAGEVALPLAPGVVAFCDVADGTLTRIHQSIAPAAGLIGALLGPQAAAGGDGAIEGAVPTRSRLLGALAVVAAVAAAHDHPTDNDALAEVLLHLQWAQSLSHDDLGAVVDSDTVGGAWAAARTAIHDLDGADRERLYALFGEGLPEVAAAIEAALLDPAASQLLAVLDRFEEETAAPASELVAAATRDPGGGAPGPGGRIGASLGGARRLSAVAAVSARRSAGSAQLWSQAAAAWEPHDHTQRVLCDWYATGAIPPRSQLGLAYFALETRRRRPPLTARTWDSHAGRK